MMLNPASDYFAEKYSDKDSYIRKNIKHKDVKAIRDYIASCFSIKSEGYYLGIKDGKVYDPSDPKEASLYVVEAIKNE